MPGFARRDLILLPAIAWLLIVAVAHARPQRPPHDVGTEIDADELLTEAGHEDLLVSAHKMRVGDLNELRAQARVDALHFISGLGPACDPRSDPHCNPNDPLLKDYEIEKVLELLVHREKLPPGFRAPPPVAVLCRQLERAVPSTAGHSGVKLLRTSELLSWWFKQPLFMEAAQRQLGAKLRVGLPSPPPVVEEQMMDAVHDHQVSLTRVETAKYKLLRHISFLAHCVMLIGLSNCCRYHPSKHRTPSPHTGAMVSLLLTAAPPRQPATSLFALSTPMHSCWLFNLSGAFTPCPTHCASRGHGRR